MKHVCFGAPNHPVEIATDMLIAMLAASADRRLAMLRQAVDAPNAATAKRALLELAGVWTPDSEAFRIGQAFELLVLTGRAEVIEETEGRAEFTVEAVGQSFDEQIAFLKQKHPVPTSGWRDIMRGQHDRAFMVAGAKDAELLNGFFAAVQRAAATWDRDAFARDFDELVEKHGWSYRGGRSWRIRTIFETNLRTSYMAGRLKQMRDPDIIRRRPYWQYSHGENGQPRVPRPQHVAWDGLVLMHDDPWWDVHFPPNDWLCSCGVRTLSARDLERLGKAGPDTAPPTRMTPRVDRATGEVSEVPNGVGYGWDYMPGDHWTRGLVPSVLIDGGRPRAGNSTVSIDLPDPLAELVSGARSLAAPPAVALPGNPASLGGFEADAYQAVMQFLAQFGVQTLDGEALHVDQAGHRLAISADLFRDRSGAPKAGKRGRLEALPYFAQAITEPDEIWLQVLSKQLQQDAAVPVLGLTYVRAAEVDGRMQGLIAGFELGGKFWEPSTAYLAGRPQGPDVRSLQGRRSGKLIWKRV